MSNIAHELRTPTTTIKGFVDGILDGTIPPAAAEPLICSWVSEESGRPARLYQNMLDLSKLESGEYRVNARSSISGRPSPGWLWQQSSASMTA